MAIALNTQDRSRWTLYHTVVLLLFAAVFISYIDRTNLSVAAIAMQEELGWTETDKGAVLSSFFVGYLLMMVASGALANRYGGKVVLGIAVVWWSLFTILTPPAALLSMTGLIAARIALGLGEAAVFPASINMIGRWVPAAHRSRATAMLIECNFARHRVRLAGDGLARAVLRLARAFLCVRRGGARVGRRLVYVGA